MSQGIPQPVISSSVEAEKVDGEYVVKGIRIDVNDRILSGVDDNVLYSKVISLTEAKALMESLQGNFQFLKNI